MKIILAATFAVILSTAQKCNDNKTSENSSSKNWTEPKQTEQTTGTQQNTSTPANQQTQVTDSQENKPQQQNQAQQDPNLFRLSVSFYSIGTGINSQAKDKFDTFLAGYTPKVTASSKRWGREGEIDYCLRLSELTSDQQVEFVKKARAVLNGAEHVNINENAPCKN